MKIIYCDLCGEKIGDVSLHGVESLDDDTLFVQVGEHKYGEICGKCYSAVFKFVEELKKKQ